MTQNPETKETRTPLATILSNKDEFEMFNQAVCTWEKETKNTLNALHVMGQIGRALNLLNVRGEEKGIKRSELTRITKTAFPGLDRRERSDFRAIANVFIEVKCFVEFSGIKSLNPTYLLNAWRKAVKEDQENLAEARKELQESLIAADGGLDLNGEVIADKKGSQAEIINRTKDANIFALNPSDSDSDEDLLDEVFSDMDKKEETIFSDTASPLKSGYDHIVRPNALIGKEVIKNVYLATNQAITYFNEGKLKDKDIGALEAQLTRTLRHINGIDVNETRELKIA